MMCVSGGIDKGGDVLAVRKKKTGRYRAVLILGEPNGREEASVTCRRVCLKTSRQVSMPSLGFSGVVWI